MASLANDSSDKKSDDSGLVKLVVYDFDQTISQEHLYHVLGGGQLESLEELSDDRLREIFGGPDRLKRLDTHFSRVSSKATIAIISYGYVAVIARALERMGLGKYWKDKEIIGNDSLELKRESGRKHQVIKKWRIDQKLKRDQTLFVDDDAGNTRQAESAGTCLTLHISEREGMTNEQMIQIEKLVGSYVSQTISSTSDSKGDSDADKKAQRPSGILITSPKTTSRQGTGKFTYNEDDKESAGKVDLKKYIPKVPDSLLKQWDNRSESGTPVINVGRGLDSPEPSMSASVEIGTPVLPN